MASTMPSGTLAGPAGAGVGACLGAPFVGAAAASVISDHERLRAVYHSGRGCPALQTLSLSSGTWYVRTTAVAKPPASEMLLNSSLSPCTNRVWSTKLE